VLELARFNCILDPNKMSSNMASRSDPSCLSMLRVKQLGPEGDAELLCVSFGSKLFVRAVTLEVRQ